MSAYIKEESLGFLDDSDMVCPIWQVVSETVFGTEFTDFDTLTEATAFMRRNPNDEHLVQGCDEDGCVISNAYALEDIVG